MLTMLETTVEKAMLREVNTSEQARNELHDYYLDVGKPLLALCASMGLFLMPLPNGLRMGMYAVTQRQYEAVMGTNPSHFSIRGAGSEWVRDMDTSDFPVEMVSALDADEFCRWLSQMAAGGIVRLPTADKWEYACRAGTTTLFHCGDSIDSTQANFDGNFPHGTDKIGPYLRRTCKVGSYEPNPWGLYDMHGNVWEWCADWYASGPYPDREIRGGGWNSFGGDCRSADRYWNTPGYRFIFVGFRVCLGG